MTTRISNDHPSAIQAYNQNQQQPKTRVSDSASRANLPADRVDLSPQARELAKELTEATRIIREKDATSIEQSRRDRVEDIERRLRTGSYQPPLREVAARMLPALQALDEE